MRLQLFKTLNLLIIFVSAVKNPKQTHSAHPKTRQITCQKQEKVQIVAIYLDLARMMHDAWQISIGLQTIKGVREIAPLPLDKPGNGKRCQERANDQTHKYKLNYSCRFRTS